jgi:hypothetical protein
MARWIGAAPRQRGNKEAWIFKPIAHTTKQNRGNLRQKTQKRWSMDKLDTIRYTNQPSNPSFQPLPHCPNQCHKWSFICIMPMPVVLSPARMARWIGAGH